MLQERTFKEIEILGDTEFLNNNTENLIVGQRRFYLIFSEYLVDANIFIDIEHLRIAR
jgi:hypothetical protein